MKKITNFLLAASVIALSASCNKEIDQVVPDQTAKSTVLTAHLDNGVNTRTSLSGNDVFWSADDAIMAFVGTASHTSTQTEVSNNGATAKFTFEGSIEPTYAFYPVDDNAQIDNSGVITTTIPSEQVAAPGTFANGASLAIAKVENVNDIHFKNAGALVAFKINAPNHNVVSMTLYGTETSGKGMTGQVAVSIDGNNEVTTSCTGEDYVKVQGAFAADNYYYAVIAPGTYSNVKIVFTDDEGKTATYTKDTDLEINRNDHLRIGVFSPADSRWKVEKKYYTKVTSTDNLGDGQYLIVYEGGSVAFNGGLDNLDVAFNTIDVTINDNLIPSDATTDAASFYLAFASDGATIKSKSGYYIGNTGNKNGLKSSQTTEYKNTISIDGNENAVISSSNSHILRFNAAVNDKRFRYYGSGQQAITLYALETAARTPAELSFSSPTAEAYVGQTEFTGPQLTKNPADISVTWSSSQPSVAYIDPTSGEIHLNNAGTTKITASFAGNSEYAPATAFYTLTVKPAYTITLQNVNDGKVFVGAANSSSVKFKVTSSYAWESSVSFVDGINNSFTVTPNQNDDAGEVEVTVNCAVENQSEDDRLLGTITISNDGDEKTIQVWQFGFSDEPTTYTMTISSSSKPENSECDVVWYREANTTLTHDGISWNASVEGTLNFVGANAWCTIGTANQPATKITLSTTGFAGKTIVAARLKGHCTSEEGPVLSITAGSTKMLENEPLIRTTATVYESSNGNVTLSAGEALTFEITSNANAGIYIYYVEVDYK